MRLRHAAQIASSRIDRITEERNVSTRLRQGSREFYVARPEG
jgi:hypothetical protein